MDRNASKHKIFCVPPNPNYSSVQFVDGTSAKDTHFDRIEDL